VRAATVRVGIRRPVLDSTVVRRTLAALCFVLACLLPAVALGTWWAYGLATDTDHFDRVAAPLASDDHVQSAVAGELVRVATARLSGAGVPSAGSAAARGQVRVAANALVQSSAYRTAWRSIQRATHARLVARLTGDVTAPLTLDLAPVAAALRAKVAQSPALRAAGVPDAIVDPAPVVVLDRAEVRDAKHATDVVRIVRGIAIPGAVLALLGVLLTAGSAAAGLVRTGLAVGVATLLVVLSDALARASISSGGEAGRLRLAVYDVLTDGLTNWKVGGAIAAVALVALGAAFSALGREGSRAPRA
jgi:hypothetical protein